MADEIKDDTTYNPHLDEGLLEVIKMGPQKAHPMPLSVRIMRTKYNHRRSQSERISPIPRANLGSTLTQLIGEHPDSSGFSSERVPDSPKSASSISSTSGQARELYDLRNRNDELMAHSMSQRTQIVELETKVELLVDAYRQKEEVAERAANNNTLCEKRLQEMATLESDKWKLTLEIDTLRQVIQDQAESLEALSNDEQIRRGPDTSTHLILTLGQDSSVTDKEMHIQALQQKITELGRVMMEKDKETKNLLQMLRSKDLGLMEFERTIDETCRRRTTVESELNAASREMDNLRHRASILQDTVENRNHELHAMEQELEAEKEATRIAGLEKERVLEKYEALAKEKVSKDKTFMHLYEELSPTVNVQYGSEVDSDQYYSEGGQEYDVTSEGYCHLEFDQHIPRRHSTKCKPTRAPPPVPSPQAKQTAGKIAEEPGSRKEENVSDETKRLLQADYEYFLMSSIAVRMNLAAMYNKDEIMAVDLGKLWEVCRKSQIPMNTYYFYIEDALREEFNLPELAYLRSALDQRPINRGCCSVM